MKFFLLKYRTSYQGIVLGIVFFTLGNSLISFNSDIITAFFCFLGWAFIVFNVIKLKKISVPFKGTELFLFRLYLFFSIVMIVRGYLIDYSFQWISFAGFINFHFIAPFYILPYVLPLCVFLGVRQIEFRTLVKINVVFNLLFIIFFVVNIWSIRRESFLNVNGLSDGTAYQGLAVPTIYFFVSTGFFVLCKDFLTKKQWRLNLLAWFLATITVAIGARRGSTFILLLQGLGVVYFYVFSLKGNYKVLGIFSIAVVFLSLIVAYFYLEDTLFAFISERGLEDNRSGVDEALLSQMTDTELWFGKGLNGRYYYPIFKDDYLEGWRYSTETGFYNLVLKGGYVFAFLYILVLLIPAILGIFKSHNTLTKAFGLYIILSLIELYPFGWPMFNLKFFIIWIGVIFCWNPVIRKMNNNQIKQIFF